MAKKLVSIVVFILGISLMISLTRSLWKLRSAQQRLSTLEGGVASARDEKESLEEVAAWRRTLDFVEQEARNRLQMVKRGEKIVVLPSEEKYSGSEPSGIIMGQDTRVPTQLAPLEQWAKLFGIFAPEDD